MVKIVDRTVGGQGGYEYRLGSPQKPNVFISYDGNRCVRPSIRPDDIVTRYSMDVSSFLTRKDNLERPFETCVLHDLPMLKEGVPLHFDTSSMNDAYGEPLMSALHESCQKIVLVSTLSSDFAKTQSIVNCMETNFFL